MLVFAYSCSDDDDDDVMATAEFVAKLNDFTSYKNWEMVDYKIGEANPSLGTAHMADNSNYSPSYIKVLTQLSLTANTKVGQF